MSKDKRGPVAEVQHGGVTVKIYQIGAVSTASKVAFRFKLKGQKHVTRVNLTELKRIAKQKAQLLVQGIATNVKSADISELIAARRIATEQGVPLVPAMQEWEAAKKLAGPALLAIAQEHADAKADDVVERVTLREAWDRCLTSLDKAGKKATMSYGAKANTICRGLGEGVMLDTLTTPVITKWAETVKDAVTRNDLVGRLGMLFRWAQGQKLFPEERVIPTDRVPSAKEKKPDIGILTPPQFKTVLELVRAQAPQYLACTAMAGFSGIRSDEVHGKKAPVGEPRSSMHRQLWSDVHVNKRWDGGHFNVTVAKENTPSWRFVPIPPALAAWLKICPRKEGEKYVCIAGAMERVRELCREAKKRGELDFDLPQNCFRHSAITYKIPLIGIVKCAEESGNSTQEITSRYRRPMLPEVAKKWWAIRPDSVTSAG